MSIVLENIIKAVIAVNDVKTSNEERSECYQALEALKSGTPDDYATAGFELISRNDALISHIGWAFIEEIIRFKWNDISVEFRLELRRRILTSLESTPLQVNIECIARCVVSMMEHEWPQNWMDLVLDLDKLSQLSAYHCTTVFAIFRRLVENVVTMPSVASPSRRKDMHNGLVLYMPDMIKLALDRLESCNQDDDCTLAIKHIIGWLAVVCEWVPTSAIEAHLNRMVDSVVVHLRTHSRNIYEQAARCLAELALRTKKDKHEDALVVNAFFRTDIISAILSVTSEAAEEAHSSEDHYKYLKALCDLLTSLGNHLAKTWTASESPPNFEMYLLAITAFFNHPSLYLKLEACDVLVALCQHPHLEQDPILKTAMETVLEKVPSVMERVGFPSELPLSAAGHYSQMDFDDDVVWYNTFVKFREHVRVLVQSSIHLHFARLLSICENWIFVRLIANPEYVRQVEWEPMQKFSKAVIQGGFDKGLVDENTRDALTTVSDSMMDTMNRLTNWDLLSELLSVHSSFAPTFNNHPTGLFKYIGLMERCLSHSNGHKDLNRHCISQILRVVTNHPDYFKLNARLVVDMCQSIQNKVSLMQTAQLLQVLAALSNVVESEETKIELLRMAFLPPLQYMIDSASCFDSVEAFVAMNGFNLKPPSCFEEGESRQDITRRKLLRRNLSTLEGVIQQVNAKSPLGSVLQQLYPMLFKLNKVILELNTPRAAALFHPEYKAITDMTIAERQQIYCTVGEVMEQHIGSKQLHERQNASDMARQYVTSISDNCITIIMICAMKFGDTLYSSPNALEWFSGVTAHIEHMPHFRVRHWVKKAWRAIVCSCPHNSFALIAPTVVAITDNLQYRLDGMWQQVATIDYDAEPSEAELFNEHMTCVLSREYLHLLRMIYLASDGNFTNSDDKRAAMLSPLGEWLFSEQIAIRAVMSTLFSSLIWRDTQCPIKSHPVCKAFVDKLSTGYEDRVAVYMFESAIKSLEIHGSDEVACAPALGLVFHIYITLRPFSTSLAQVLRQIPEMTTETIETFDKKILALISGEETLADKQKKEMTKKLLRAVISQTPGEQHRRPVFLRPLPPIEKRQREPTPEVDFVGVAALFGES